MIIARRLLNTPLALLPARAEALLAELRVTDVAEPKLAALASPDTYDRRPYEVIEGVAIVPVGGVLVNDDAWWWFGETSYAAIDRTLTEAVVDPEVKAIALHIDSPGGEVAGCFDLADKIYGLRGQKPIWAILDEMAFSAAYALACAADRIIVPRTGGVGSIGIITLRLDVTEMLAQMGIKITSIQFGERKTDSYPTTPLSDDARVRIQADVDALGEMFVALVARNRGVDAGKIRSMEAGCFLGEAGRAAGLADDVMSPAAAFVSLAELVA